MKTRVFWTVIALAAGLSVTTATADVSLPKIFGDHMVLQQGATLPVWGHASPGERVSVSFAGQNASAVASTSGAWRIDLKPIAARAEGQTLIVRGANTITCQDVVVGDVWLASGQSNMEFGIQSAADADTAIREANDPGLRMFFVPWATSLTPLDQIAPTPADSLNGKWQVCSADVLRSNWAWHGFSAVAYTFARDLRAYTHRPIGVIGAYKGSTGAQTWISLAGLQQDPRLSGFVDDHQKLVDHFADASQTFPAKQKAYLQAMASWSPPAGKPVPPPRPDGGFNGPANAFNGMIAPLIPYAIKGVVWYQGESNANTLADAQLYRPLFSRLIVDWRRQWGAGDFPFLYVQLAGFRNREEPRNGAWPWLRDAQAKALSLPKTGMATAADIGNPTYIHPADKADVGHRLARVARKIAYDDHAVATGPAYQSMAIKGASIRVRFNDGQDLHAGTPPWTYDGHVPPKPDRVTGFTIAAADEQFKPADARIEGDTVVVSNADVAAPVAVRYGWSDVPDGNLYGRDEQPVAPFRTDDFEPAPMDNLSIVPFAGGPAWQATFKARLERKKSSVELIFDGDSITDWFQTTGRAVWTKSYGDRHAIDFAIAGDQTGQVLWRLQHGQVDGLSPKLVVLLIGTNNTIRDSSAHIAAGIDACVKEYLQRCPTAHVLLLSVFPRRASPQDVLRTKIAQINETLAKKSFGPRVTRVDIGHLFVDAAGNIRTDLMPGALHPNAEGYQQWADAIEPYVSQYVPHEPAK